MPSPLLLGHAGFSSHRHRPDAQSGPQKPLWPHGTCWVPSVSQEETCCHFNHVPISYCHAFAHAVCTLCPEHPSPPSSPNLPLWVCDDSVQHHHFLKTPRSLLRCPTWSRGPSPVLLGPLLCPASRTFYFMCPPKGCEFFEQERWDSPWGP